MKTIAKTTGASKEYAPYSINFCFGCGNLCDYCYNAELRKRFPTLRPKNGNVEVKPGFIDQLKIDAPKFAKKMTAEDIPVMMSFVTDPFCYENIQSGITESVITELVCNSIPIAFLTKNILRSYRGIYMYKELRKLMRFGVSLTYPTADQTLRHEPGTESPADRIYGLRRWHEENIKTFVSLEPIIKLEYALEHIRNTHEFTDMYMLGLMTGPKAPKYSPEELREFVAEVHLFCRGTPYYIKNSIRKIIPDMGFMGNSGNAHLRQLFETP